MAETFTFQAETQQLLDILIHSLYTDREIFMRELISNASDALNRLQFEQLTNSEMLDSDVPLEIRITTDEEAGTITISDTGIGMTADEIQDNLGTIARSGAKNFMQALQDAPNKETATNIIGQFGVGFYSVFMAADKVQVISRSHQPDAEAIIWEANGGTEYTMEVAEKESRGTDIVIYLKEDAKEFLQAWRIKNIITKHSDYVAFPIYVGDDEKPANKQTALWRQSPREIEDDEYKSFYQMLTMDFGEPLMRVHMRAEGVMQFYALLYVPSTSEPSPFSPRKDPGLKLYARKVLIDDYHKDLLPEYLQFIQGVVDSEDIPLSVTRESVRANRIMANLKKTITSKVLSELKQMANKETEKYLEIFAEFGRFLKQGVVMSPTDKDDLLPLLFWQTSHDEDEDSFHSLNDYVGRMVDGQDEIYYVISDDYHSAKRSPHLDPFRQRGIEVLYFCDPVDSMLPMGLTDYKGHKLRSVDEADINLKDVGTVQEDESQAEALEETTFESLLERVKRILGERVSDVRESQSLVGSPARLVSDDNSGQRHMFRINRLLDKEYQMPVKALELNPRHPLLHNVSDLLADNGDNPLIDVVIEQVFETALLQDGIHPDPAAMAERLTALMQAATGSADSVDFSKVAPPKAEEVEPSEEAE
ncbi:MAG: molecular chaperone HtpG [Anaerolineae bacterium]|nr:molecular chaperone HtpG [Anaerolineae bacterium]